MSVILKRKDHPLSMRLPEGDIALTDRAAALVIVESAPLHMTEECFEAFSRAMSAPGAAVPEMVDALRRPAPWQAAV